MGLQRKKSLSYRLKNRPRQKSSGRSVPRWFIIVNSLMIGTAFFAGVYLGSNNPVLNEKLNQTVEVDGWKFHFTSEEEDDTMKGNWGYTYPYTGKEIWLNKRILDENLDDQLLTTCNHEVLHVLGVGTEHHGRIDMYEEEIRDPVCDKLLEKVT
jgi:hypothetical protein